MNSIAPASLMMEAFGVAGLAATSYASTNFDNLLVMSAYGVKPGFKPVFVRLTFLGVCLTVLIISFALAQAADSFAAGKIHYLGLIPLALGLQQIGSLLLWRRAKEDAEAAQLAPQIGVTAYLGFALVLLANSGDSVGMMTPLLADLQPAFVPACFLAAVAAAAAMSWLANFLAQRPQLKIHLERVAKWGLPFVLVAIGLLIFANQPSDLLVE